MFNFLRTGTDEAGSVRHDPHFFCVAAAAARIMCHTQVPSSQSRHPAALLPQCRGATDGRADEDATQFVASITPEFQCHAARRPFYREIVGRGGAITASFLPSLPHRHALLPPSSQYIPLLSHFGLRRANPGRTANNAIPRVFPTY